MNEAKKKLEDARRQDAVDKQEQALRELEQAKSELEEILRQLREEEIERILAMLEARFRKMLQMQEEVYEGTLRLDKIPAAERTHNQEIESSRLSSKESQIVVEVDKAALLLREDGGAVAFPEAVEQMRDDMQQVVSRLAGANVGKITQGIEEDVIAALKDMIAALKKAQEGSGGKEEKAGRVAVGRAAGSAADRHARRTANDPHFADAGQHADRAVLQIGRRRAGGESRTGRGAAAACRAAGADSPRYPRPRIGEEPMNDAHCTLNRILAAVLAACWLTAASPAAAQAPLPAAEARPHVAVAAGRRRQSPSAGVARCHEGGPGRSRQSRRDLVRPLPAGVGR